MSYISTHGEVAANEDRNDDEANGHGENCEKGNGDDGDGKVGGDEGNDGEDVGDDAADAGDDE